MFTGIIEETGSIQRFDQGSSGATLTVAAQRIIASLKKGDSVAVNGVCLTVTQTERGVFGCDLSAETLQRTSLGHLGPGRMVNLERPVAVGERFGGHFVTGHIDGRGRLLSRTPSGEGAVLAFDFPGELERFLVHKGSIAVDGISLTIASLNQHSFTVAIIPHTLEVTNLRCLHDGAEVNLEVDILGKYFERFFQLGLAKDRAQGLTFDYLREQGF